VLGATVIGVASTPQKREFVLAQGAHHACDYAQLRETVNRNTNGQGADVVLDPVGGDAFEPALRSLAPLGRHVVVGFAAGSIPQIAANLLLVKNISAVGHNMGRYLGWGPVDERARWAPRMRDMMDQLFEWTIQGRLKPTVSHRFELDEFRQAMAVLRERRAQGKVIIRIGDAL
jgi:NADPH2:quinone reductase